MTLADLRRCLALVEEAQGLYDDLHLKNTQKAGQAYSFRELRSGLISELSALEAEKLRAYEQAAQ